MRPTTRQGRDEPRAADEAQTFIRVQVKDLTLGADIAIYAGPKQGWISGEVTACNRRGDHIEIEVDEEVTVVKWLHETVRVFR